MIFFNIERVTSSTLLGSGKVDRAQHTSRPVRGSAGSPPALRVGFAADPSQECPDKNWDKN